MPRAAPPPLPLLLTLLVFHGYTTLLNSGAAAMYARDFGLDERDLARAFAWIAAGSLGTALLSRWMDRVGRRRVLVVAVVGFAACCAATALARGFAELIVAQICLAVFQGALHVAATVIIAEELPTEARARGQAWFGILMQVGSGIGLVAVAVSAGFAGSWRWAWALGALVLVTLVRAPSLRETERFASAEARGQVGGRWAELFSDELRGRSIVVLGAYAGLNVTVSPILAFLLFHAEVAIGLAPLVATAIVIAGGGAGIAGFPLGAALANRWGRRPTAAICGIGFALLGATYYRVTPDFPISPIVGLAASFALASVLLSAGVTGLRTALPELYPTRLRGTIQGVITTVSAGAALVGLWALSILTETQGGLANAMPFLAVVPIPGLLAYWILIPETRGLELRE